MRKHVRRYDTARPERGQATIALVGVIILLVIAAVALSWIGEAIVHRARARNVADAIALATAADPHEGESLASWYRSRGVVIEQHGNQTTAASGPAHAIARAELIPGNKRSSPLLQAVIARAEQLTGHTLTTARWNQHWVFMSIEDGAIFERVAIEFGMCVATESLESGGGATFTWC